MQIQYKVSILIVDDNSDSRFSHQFRVSHLFKEINSEELNVKTASCIEEMYKYLKQESFHVILLDRELGRDNRDEIIDAIDHIPRILELRPNSRILVITSHADTSLAVKAMQSGAQGYITKDSSEENQKYCNEQILQALKSAQIEIDLITKMSSSSNIGSYICKSEAMRDIDEKLKSLAGVNTTVLILGESGLGKTHAAKRLSLLSKEYHDQKSRPFINININAISKSLQESELFGSEKGAFTSSSERKQGYFEIASGGDLFLDEIGDATPELQGALLKVIEEKQFRRIGGQQDLKMNARLIFATNKNLEKMVEKGEFRQDLYARICAIKIEMPALRSRKEDIPFICQILCEDLSQENGKTFSYFSFPKALQDYFLRDDIPFNIRGIRNDLERLLIFCPLKPNGKRDFTKWRSILNYTSPEIPTEQIFNRDIHSIANEFAESVAHPDGIGLAEALSLLEFRAIAHAIENYKSNKEQAMILKVSPPGLIAKKNKMASKEAQG